MASELRLTTSGTADATVHWLPCSIAQTGPAPVSSYFLPSQAGKGLVPPAASAYVILRWKVSLPQHCTPRRQCAAGTSVDGKQVQEAAFRGRQLRGALLTPCVTPVSLRKPSQVLTELTGRCI